jgi:SAM-dependent methyltransferase
MMSDDRDDEVLDLTEEATAEAETEDTAAGEAEPEAAAESRPPGPPPGSPFTLLARPRSADEIQAIRVAETPAGEKKTEARPSFVPRESETPVLTSPVVRLGEGGPSIAPKATVADKGQEDEDDEAKTADEEPSDDEAAAADEAEEQQDRPADADDQEEEILDLGQEFVVAEVSDDDVGSEPIPLVSESLPPAEAEGEEAAPATEAEDDADSGEVEAHPFDFGVPEMVFDTVSEPPPDVTAEVEGEDEGEDEGEELDEADLELQEEEEEEEEPAAAVSRTQEIDLSQAEEIKPPKRPAIPIADVGPAAAAKRKGRRRRRRRKAEWWAQIFDDDYVALLPEYSKRDTRRELDYIQSSLGVKAGELVLDLACGGGRQAVGMARRNFRVVGVDISLSMLARAGELAQEEGQKINFIHGDMRDLGFDKTFDGVYCLGTSFGFFDERTNAFVLEGIYRALKPGRRFLLEMVNRDYIINKQPNLIWFEGDGVVCMEETDFSYITSRLHVNRQIIVGNGERQKKHEFSVRLYSLHEIGQLLHHAGFSVVQVGGHPATPGAFFGADSAQVVIVAERRR